MGDGLIGPTAASAQLIITSLNAMFSQKNITDTIGRYNVLKFQYPNLFRYASKATGTDGRQRTLRHAAWLLTADIDFSGAPPTDPYPAGRFRAWLKWLTWIQHSPPGNTVVKVDGAGSGEAPAQAILETIRQALDRPYDPANPHSVRFKWNPAPAVGPGGKVVDLTIEVTRPAAGNYTVTVTALDIQQLEQMGFKETDEDDF